MVNYSSNKIPSVHFPDTAIDGPPPKIDPRKCKHCGEVYDQYNIYNGFCSYTCRARYNKNINPIPKPEQYDEE